MLDDIFDKIDDKRVQALMRWVTAGEFGQFITDTDLGRIPGMFRETGADVRYEVKWEPCARWMMGCKSITFGAWSAMMPSR